MTNRTCQKCNQNVLVNEKLGYMECVSGLHIEPINLITAQWWNQCPECGTMGLNYANQERFTQKFGENGQPIFINKKIVMEEKTPESIKCKACGTEWTK